MLKKKPNMQARKIICLFVVSKYNLHFLKKLFINSFSRQNEISCSTKNLGVISWTKWRISKKQTCIKTLLVFSSKLSLKLPQVLRRVRLSLTNWGQWRRKISVDSTSFSQLHTGFNIFWMPCLNLFSLKWLKLSLSLIIRQIPLELWKL